MKHLSLALLFSFLLSLCSCVSTRVIIVSEKGINSQSCLKAASPYPCRSLEYVASHNVSNTVIRISDTNYTLHGVARFSHVENITITGEQLSTTFINCSGTENNEKGIIFEYSHRIHLRGLHVSQCGLTIPDKSMNNLTSDRTAILIKSCSLVTTFSIAVTWSYGQGLTLINTVAEVHMMSSLFAHNTNSAPPEGRPHGGGGLQIIFESQNTDVVPTTSNYTIVNCTFIQNCAYRCDNCSKHFQHRPPYYTRGGGIRLLIMENSTQNQVLIQNTIIQGNSATYGGGLYVYISSGTSSSQVHILMSNFTGNSALVSSGGGADVGFTNALRTSKLNPPFQNCIVFEQTKFSRNTALYYGGGLSAFVRFEERDRIQINNCHFQGNRATAGAAAVYVGPDLKHSRAVEHYSISNVHVCNTDFFNNSATLGNQTAVNNGAFFINKVFVVFCGRLNFSHNTNTALYITSETSIIFENNTQVMFDNNIGDKGGAIYLGRGSKIEVENSVAINFTNNKASYGGAIFSESPDLHAVVYQSCFITSGTNVSFFFFKNSATSQIGNDIFASSIQPCKMKCRANATQLFTNSCIGNFFFDGYILHKRSIHNHLSTGPYRIITKLNSHPELMVFPGMNLYLNILDEVEGNVGKFFPLAINVQKIISNISVIPGNINDLTVYGMPGEHGAIVLQASGIQTKYNIRLVSCPPGYVTNETGSSAACKCSYNVPGKGYLGMKCKRLSVGLWAGYIGNDTREDTMYTGVCAPELCYHITNNHLGYWKLAINKTTPQSLEQLVCKNNRRGVLCGRCAVNMSVYYHSIDYTCAESSSCGNGIALYVASELLPVTILFLLILLFNISVTSGALYSFVFYAQTISALNVILVASNVTTTDSLAWHALNDFHTFYAFFKLDVLTGHTQFTFCIVETDKIMVLLMFKYATTLYALLLVLATILVLRRHSCYSCIKLCRRCGRRNIRGSIVDGVSAFLVLCYTQCVQITYQILIPAQLFKIGLVPYKTVPLFDGNLEYLHGEHLWYAVPAFLCIVFILIPPPTILLLEPLLTKLFSLDYFNHTRSRMLYNRLRLKLMPFLDSFQACFKDRHRYIAGLYFIYRLIVPVSCFAIQFTSIYSIALSFLFLVLFFHTLVQPYKKKWHNLLELSIFINLVMVVTVNLIGFVAAKWFSNEAIRTEDVTARYQAFLLSLPIVYLVCYAAANVYRLLPAVRWCKWKRKPVSIQSPEEDFGIPARLLYDESGSYNTF